MGILDDAIKEHLELKRQHGAGESELQQLEDEAFGAAERPGDEESAPDPLAEAPTEFMSQPDLEPAQSQADDAGGPEEAASGTQEASSRRSPRAEIGDLQEAPPTEPPEYVEEAKDSGEHPEEPDEPAEEPSPAMEHEAVSPEQPEPEASEPEPEIPAGPSTEERQAIAEQPTEMFDVEEELASSQSEAPSEEELVEENIEEPRLAPIDPLSSLDEDSAAEIDDEADDFFDEKRLSDELDQALEAPAEDDDEPEYEPEPESEEEPEGEAQPPANHDEDVLEETPDFLEETPEDDQLWFEQKPPQDFDFDD